MVAPRLALSVLAVGLGSVQGWAQEGPSFDCRYARTATEVVICDDPVLARAEMRMFGAYQGLVDAMGERPARRIADRMLERRQACEGRPECIARQLAISERVFERRAARALGEEPPPDRIAAIPLPPPRPAAPVPPGVAPTSEEIAAIFATAEPVSSDAATAQATSSDATGAAPAAPSGEAAAGPAPFDTPTAWAFMDLARQQRAQIQDRLAEAGLLDGPAEGSWDMATLAAIQAFASSPQGEGFDLSTRTGARLALDFIRSDAYGDAIAGAEW